MEWTQNSAAVVEGFKAINLLFFDKLIYQRSCK